MNFKIQFLCLHRNDVKGVYLYLLLLLMSDCVLYYHLWAWLVYVWTYPQLLSDKYHIGASLTVKLYIVICAFIGPLVHGCPSSASAVGPTVSSTRA